jgi:hypothetical protein
VHVADAQRTVFDEAQAHLGEQGDEILRGDKAMAAVKMLGEPGPLFRTSRKVNGQDTSAGFQYSTDLESTLLPGFARQVMQHHGGQHGVELPVGKRQRFGQRVLEGHVLIGLFRLLRCARNHLRRCIDSLNGACRADAPLRGDGECPGPTPPRPKSLRPVLALPSVGSLPGNPLLDRTTRARPAGHSETPSGVHVPSYSLLRPRPWS